MINYLPWLPFIKILRSQWTYATFVRNKVISSLQDLFKENWKSNYKQFILSTWTNNLSIYHHTLPVNYDIYNEIDTFYDDLLECRDERDVTKLLTDLQVLQGLKDPLLDEYHIKNDPLYNEYHQQIQWLESDACKKQILLCLWYEHLFLSIMMFSYVAHDPFAQNIWFQEDSTLLLEYLATKWLLNDTTEWLSTHLWSYVEHIFKNVTVQQLKNLLQCSDRTAIDIKKICERQGALQKAINDNWFSQDIIGNIANINIDKHQEFINERKQIKIQYINELLLKYRWQGLDWSNYDYVSYDPKRMRNNSYVNALQESYELLWSYDIYVRNIQSWEKKSLTFYHVRITNDNGIHDIYVNYYYKIVLPTDNSTYKKWILSPPEFDRDQGIRTCSLHEFQHESRINIQLWLFEILRDNQKKVMDLENPEEFMLFGIEIFWEYLEYFFTLKGDVSIDVFDMKMDDMSIDIFGIEMDDVSTEDYCDVWDLWYADDTMWDPMWERIYHIMYANEKIASPNITMSIDDYIDWCQGYVCSYFEDCCQGEHMHDFFYPRYFPQYLKQFQDNVKDYNNLELKDNEISELMFFLISSIRHLLQELYIPESWTFPESKNISFNDFYRR